MATHESEQQDSDDQEIETKIKFFILLKKTDFNKLKKLKSYLGGIQTKKYPTSRKVCKEVSFDTSIFC